MRNIQKRKWMNLKGQCHEIFCFMFFSWITFPQAPDNHIRIISNLFENSRRYSQVKLQHLCQRHRWQMPPVSMTPVANCRWYQRHRRQICHRYQRHWRQILPPVPIVLLTPVANLPSVANHGNNIRLQTPDSELEGKNLYVCFLYYPKVTKKNY